MELSVVPLHENKQYMQETCQLINDEWKRSETARMRSLECSCDKLPTSLILLDKTQVLGHLKLSPIPRLQDSCFLESVVIQRGLRGKGLGTTLMQKTEEFCREELKLKTIYLSTKGQEGFYSKLGYVECPPISIYGSYTPSSSLQDKVKVNNLTVSSVGPVPPPMPQVPIMQPSKTFMMKHLYKQI